jgi:small multidrug resistance family-3 protein
MVGSTVKDLGRLVGLLVLSALLEVGGDAGMRTGLQGSGSNRVAGFVIGAVLLITYGLVVNLSKLDFSKLMGIYIAIFFVVAQLISVVVFKEKIHLPVLVGGALIIAGGLVMTFWHAAS